MFYMCRRKTTDRSQSLSSRKCLSPNSDFSLKFIANHIAHISSLSQNLDLSILENSSPGWTIGTHIYWSAFGNKGNCSSIWTGCDGASTPVNKGFYLSHYNLDFNQLLVDDPRSREHHDHCQDGQELDVPEGRVYPQVTPVL